MEEDKVRALAEVADIIITIPAKVETLYERATQEGYQVSDKNIRLWKNQQIKCKMSSGLRPPQFLGQLEEES